MTIYGYRKLLLKTDLYVRSDGGKSETACTQIGRAIMLLYSLLEGRQTF